MKLWASVAFLTLGALITTLLYVQTHMKLWASVAFLTLGILAIVLGYIQFESAIPHLGTGRSAGHLNILISIAWLNLALAQYWLLTSFYSLGWMVILSIVLLIQLAIVAVLGAVSGITLPGRRSKIEVLTTIWGAQNPKEGCFLTSSSLVAMAISWIGSLWIFWSSPVGSDDARIGVALFMFVVPAIVILPSLFAVQWPSTTSPYLDDDVRNSGLVRSLASMVNNTVYWLFPVWLFREEFNHKFPDLPPFWVLLSIPVVVFVFTGLLPFFVGAYRFRAESNAILEWRKEWITDLLLILQLPQGQHRNDEIEQKSTELETEFRRRFSENEVISLYSQFAMMEEEPATHPLIEISNMTSSDEPSNLPRPVTSTPALWKEASLAQGMVLLRDFRTNQLNLGNPSGDLIGRLVHLMVTNADRLIEWDVRFSHMNELIRLRRVLDDVHAEGARDFLNGGLKEIDAERATLQPKRSYVFGGLLTILSTATVSIFKVYGEQIISALGKAVGLDSG